MAEKEIAGAHVHDMLTAAPFFAVVFNSITRLSGRLTHLLCLLQLGECHAGSRWHGHSPCGAL